MGGLGNRNSYELQWDFFREKDAAWNHRFKNLRAELMASTSSVIRPARRLDTGQDATLTCLNNLTSRTCGSNGNFNEAVSAVPRKELANPKRIKRPALSQIARQTNVSEAVKPGHFAYSAAEGRWNQDLMTAWSHRPEIMSRIVDAITPQLYGETTIAEVQRRGAGFKHLIANLGHLALNASEDK